MLKKILAACLGIGVVAVVALVVWIGPRNLIGFLTYGQQRREGALQVGDPAPAVTVVDRDGVTPRSLDEWIGPRPLVLVFGSFT